MRVLITGSKGMLGSTLERTLRSRNGLSILTSARTGERTHDHFPVDFAINKLESLLDWAKADVVIHCAALTQIDFAERNSELAFKINTNSVQEILHWIEAKSNHTQFIFISSDAVKKDGQPNATEDAICEPVNIYGQTKLASEKLIQESSSNSIAIRTTLVGSKRHLGTLSFTDQIFQSLETQSVLSLFEDVMFSPITSSDLSNFLFSILSLSVPKILNVSGSEPISKYNFGMRLKQRLCIEPSEIKNIRLSDLSLPSRRILDQTLDSSLASRIFDFRSPSIDETISSLIKERQ